MNNDALKERTLHIEYQVIFKYESVQQITYRNGRVGSFMFLKREFMEIENRDLWTWKEKYFPT